ncbi:MAG: wax ester/triacylglycerol synthase family O-acyltransferase [Deltaproteobacteria bacterium]|nr:wax ester/triacylglycerol synthase family O-acyltransferase [Deltaproteobacteria bacterium]
MPRYAYDRLTALDNSFLMLEKPNSYMHVGSTQIHKTGPLRTEGGGVDAARIRKLLAALLHRIPRYRQKLAWIPFENHPVWVDDDNFNLDFHLRHTGLPRPGTDEQLKRLSARILQQHLDRNRPLWEMWIVEGLEDDRFAIISKTHHCMIDGASGVDIMRVLMSPEPDTRTPDEPSWVPRPAPSGFELMRHEFLRRAGLPLEILRGAVSAMRTAESVRFDVMTRVRALTEAMGGSLRLPSETPFNREIGPHRRFEWLTMDLADIKKLRKSLGGSLNDIVLAIVTGAVRDFLRARHVNPDKLDFRVMAPVSVRSENEHGALGNRVSAWIVPLPIGTADRRVQLERITERTTWLKDSKSAVGAEVLTQAAEYTPSTLLALGARNMTRLLPFNLVVTNVPGPQAPMYMLGAEMLECFPNVPLTDRLGLGIALMSYNGKLCWGFNADYDLVPDLRNFVTAVEGSFDELMSLASARPALVVTGGREGARSTSA